MGWSIGYDKKWERDIGYGVPAWCDHPGCNEEIDRGLSYVCGGEPFGGEFGCGLYFCEKHLWMVAHDEVGETPQLCERCRDFDEDDRSTWDHFPAKPEHPTWLQHVLTDDSWHQWRAKNPKRVEAFLKSLAAQTAGIGARTPNTDEGDAAHPHRIDTSASPSPEVPNGRENGH